MAKRKSWLILLFHGPQSQILRCRLAGLACGSGLRGGGAERAPNANPAHRDGLLEIARRLIGGKANPRVRLYNTCFPYKYDFIREPEKIMRELIDTRGIRAIKVWPFDGAAQRNGHQYITQQDIDQALEPVRKLRDAFGYDIEIAMEFHSNWNLTAAIRIARALEPYRPMWLEDMLLPGNPDQYRELALATSLPLTISERMAGKMQFEQILAARAARFVMFDVTWCGGLTEARKIAHMAGGHQAS